MFYHLKINFNVILEIYIYIEIYNVPKFRPYDVKSVVH